MRICLFVSLILGVTLLVVGCGDDGNDTEHSDNIQSCKKSCEFEINCGLYDLDPDNCEGLCSVATPLSECIYENMSATCQSVYSPTGATAKCLEKIDTCDEYRAYFAGINTYGDTEFDQADYPCKKEFEAMMKICPSAELEEDTSQEYTCQKESEALVEFMKSIE